MFVGQPGNDETDVDQVTIDRVKSFARLGERVEAGGKPRARGFGITGQGGFGVVRSGCQRIGAMVGFLAI